MKHDDLKSLTVKAGQPVHWDVEIGGEPAPDVTWFREETRIVTTEEIQVMPLKKKKFLNIL